MAQLVGCCITGGYWGGGVPRALPALPLFCLDFLLLRANVCEVAGDPSVC